MSTERVNEYFASEASEYLDRIDEFLAGPTGAAPGELQRLARGVRGSMEMAGATQVAGVAARLEETGAAVAASTIQLSDRVLLLVRETVADLRSLIHNLPRWGSGDDDQVQTAMNRFAPLFESADAPARPVVPIESLYYDDAGPHILVEGARSGNGTRPVVDIGELLFHGEAALREAQRLRPLFAALARGEASEREMSELVEELLDLLDLGLGTHLQEA
jgi:chemotaxis protein histidine kinase CheA